MNIPLTYIISDSKGALKIKVILIITFGDDLTKSPTPLFLPLSVVTSDLTDSNAKVLITGFSNTHFSLDSINCSGSMPFHFETKLDVIIHTRQE